MEFLSEIIDSIKTGKRFEMVLNELIDIIKLFLKKIRASKVASKVKSS